MVSSLVLSGLAALVFNTQTPAHTARQALSVPHPTPPPSAPHEFPLVATGFVLGSYHRRGKPQYRDPQTKGEREGYTHRGPRHYGGGTRWV